MDEKHDMKNILGLPNYFSGAESKAFFYILLYYSMCKQMYCVKCYIKCSP